MLTLHEGRQRCALNGFRLSRAGTMFTITPFEGARKAGIQTYMSDDLEDVVLKSGSLRRGK